MQRQRGELVPIGDALSGMGGPVKAIHDATPQARHHFTRADQVNQLVTASETTPDLGFMARMMALCSLPRTSPGNRSPATSCWRQKQSNAGSSKKPYAPSFNRYSEGPRERASKSGNFTSQELGMLAAQKDKRQKLPV